MDAFRAMPGHLIRRVQQVSTALFTEECGRFDLTSVQFAALSAIADHPDMDATRLSALIAFDRSTIGSVLERLEAKGWVSRHPSALDRRVKRLRCTEAGATLLQDVAPAVARVQARLLAPLSPPDRAAMLRFLRLLADTQEATPAPLRLAANEG